MSMPGSYEYINDSHKLFAADMAYTLQYFYDECNVTTSCELYGMLMANKSIISGHSLGGAAALLVAGNAINVDETFKHQFTSLFTLSGCGVDSIEINYTFAAQNIHIPSFLLTGSSDCMCKPPFNVSIVGYYDEIPDESLGSCKYLGIIANASHCHFSSEWVVEDATCQIVEDAECNPLLPSPYKIPRQRQWEFVETYLALFMYQTLYADSDVNSIQAVQKQLENDRADGVMAVIDMNCPN